MSFQIRLKQILESGDLVEIFVQQFIVKNETVISHLLKEYNKEFQKHLIFTDLLRGIIDMSFQ